MVNTTGCVIGAGRESQEVFLPIDELDKSTYVRDVGGEDIHGIAQTG
jgi:hypothetical protein